MFRKSKSLFLNFLLIFILAACASLEKAERLNQEGQKEAAIEMAAKFLSSDDKAERAQAATLIGTIAGDASAAVREKAGKALIDHIGDPDAGVQIAVIKSIGKAAYAPAAEPLVRMVPDARGELFEVMGATLRGIGTPAIDLLVEKFHSPSQKTNQDYYKKMLILIGTSVTEAITRSLKNKSYYENKGNFEILIAIRSPAVARLMLPYIEDEEVAHLVIEGLTQLASLAVDPVMDELQKQMKGDGSEIFKERLIKTLGQLKDPRATTLLESLSQDKSELVRIAVDRALFQIRGF